MLLEGIYLLNKRYLPHKKWVLVYLEEMESPWNHLKKEFKEGMIIKNYTLSDIERRLNALNKIYESILVELLKKYKNFPNKPYEYYYRNFVQLNKKTKIDRLLEKFNKNINPEEFKKLKGFLCFNLIDTKDKVYKWMSLKSDKGLYSNAIRRKTAYERKYKN